MSCSSPTSTVEFEKEKDARWNHFDFFQQEEESETPIVYHYLTYETELPTPTVLSPLYHALPNPPAEPDLGSYQSPFEWSNARKRIIIWLSCVATMLTAFTAGSYSPAVDQMTAEWHVSSVACLLGITTFTSGFAVAPMVLAPFSEINGRKPVFMVTGVLFVVCQLCCAITQSFYGMLLARFFVGVGGSTFSTMVGGVVSDIYHTKDRNTPMALFSGAALLGTGLGPLCCGFIAQNTTWRWIFYMQAITCGTCIGIVCLFFRETRGSVLLSRKAKTLNRWYAAREAAGYLFVAMPSSDDPTGKKTPQRIRWKVKSDEERTSLRKMIGISLYRPFHMLITEPVVFWFSAWVSFSWAVLYLTLAAVPLVFRTVYGFSLQYANAVFASMAVGAVVATFISIYQDSVARSLFPTWSDKHLAFGCPESRLTFACIQTFYLPIGMFLFGWTARSDLHWSVAAVGIGIATMGIFSIYLAVFNYLADTYHRYASSALAAQSFCRNILGGVFPLITVQLFNHLGYSTASSLLGGIAILLSAVPWVLVFYGPRIRARSKFAMGLAG
jgi:multidrug resistance protein